MSYAELTRAVRAHLDQDHRYRHCVRVARSADVLAQIHGVDPRKARLAAERDGAETVGTPRELADKAGEDPEVLSAIAKHTLGDEAMSPLDCIVYLADALEPGRDFANRRFIWDLACVDLRAAMSAAIVDNFLYLASLAREPAPQTVAMQRIFDPSVSQGVQPSLN